MEGVIKMAVHVAVDLGYGFVKGISELNGNRCLFPSIVGTGFDRNIGNVFGEKSGQDLSSMHINYKGEDYFVGELAKESKNSSRIYEQERFRHEYTKILLNVATQILTHGKVSEINLSTGLPLSFYKTQAKEFQQSILGMQPTIKWKSGMFTNEELRVNIKDAVVFPQGASAIYSALINREGKYSYPELMEEGTLIALIDIGYRTTDFVVVEMNKNGSFRPRLDLTNTIDDGVSNLHWDLEQSFKERTGGADLNEYHKARILRNKFIRYRGNKVDFEDVIINSNKSISTNIADRLKAHWAEESDLFDAIFLAGGGGSEFENYIQSHFDNRLILIEENQFANAIGYYRFGKAHFSE